MVEVSANDGRVVVTATADDQTVFAYDFLIFDDDQIDVYILPLGSTASTLLTKTTDYTVSGVGQENGGDITLTGTQTVVIGTQLVLVRSTPITRSFQYATSGDFLATKVNPDFNVLHNICQELRRDIDRAITLDVARDTVFDLGNRRLSNVLDPVDAQDAATKQSVDDTLALVNAASADDRFTFIPPSGVTGTADAIVLTASDIPASPTNGYKVRFIPEADSTGAVTVNLTDGTDDWGVIALVNRALAAFTGAELKNKVPVELTYSAAEAKWVFNHGGGGDLVDDTTPQLGGPLDTNSHQVRWSKGSDIASAAALILGADGNYFDVTGVTAITSIGTVGVGTVIKLHFDGVLTLTHNATDLVLLGGANIITAAGDEAEFVEYAAGDWRCTNYQRAAGSDRYISPNQTITTAGTLSLSHGLGVIPAFLTAELECTTADAGFSVGDVMEAPVTYHDDVSSTSRGCSWVKNSTTLEAKYGNNANVFVWLNKSTGARILLTNTSWVYRIKAYP